jgi:hypothetical protein
VVWHVSHAEIRPEDRLAVNFELCGDEFRPQGMRGTFPVKRLRGESVLGGRFKCEISSFRGSQESFIIPGL